MTEPNEQLDPQIARRREIIHQYARMGSRGPTKCHATKQEIADARDRGVPDSSARVRPIIYDNIEKAEACAVKLRELDGVQQYAYVCRRSRSGHAHLSSRPSREQQP